VCGAFNAAAPALPTPKQIRTNPNPQTRDSFIQQILSTMKFVPYVCPWAAHFLLIGHSAGLLSVPAANGFTLTATLLSRM
jgi:hypothetical protein